MGSMPRLNNTVGQAQAAEAYAPFYAMAQSYLLPRAAGFEERQLVAIDP